jgi:hypothetical protein
VRAWGLRQRWGRGIGSRLGRVESTRGGVIPSRSEINVPLGRSPPSKRLLRLTFIAANEPISPIAHGE